MPTRRALLFGAAATVTAAAAAGIGAIQLAEAGLIPGKGMIDERLGRCDAPVPPVSGTPGPVVAGTFTSALRGREVGYRVAYPPGYAAGARLPVCLVLHGYGGDETAALAAGNYPAYLATVTTPGPGAGSGSVAAGTTRVPAFALASVAGGTGYWHPHPGDDPLGMLAAEFLPVLGAAGLEVGRVAALGYSMGAFGALLCGLTWPDRFVRIEASTPAFWRSYDEAQRVNPGAFTSAQDWQRYGDLLARAPEISRLPAAIYVGRSDPFEPAITRLRSRLADPAMVHVSTGCHDGRFWSHNAPGQLRAIGAALAA